VIVSVVILEETLGIKSLSSHKISESLPNSFCVFLVKRIRVGLSVNRLGPGIVENDIN